MAVVLTGFSADSGAEHGDVRRQFSEQGLPAFTPDIFTVDYFAQLSEILKKIYKESELRNVLTAQRVAFREEEKSILVRLENVSYPIRIEENRVTAEVVKGETISAEAADFMAASAKTNKLNGKPVSINGSDENKIVLYFAAQKHGLQVSNLAEIKKLQQEQPSVWNKIEAQWINSQKDTVMSTPEKTKETFNMPLGVIALKMNLVDEAGQEKAAARQAELLAIATKRPADDTSNLLFLKPDQVAAKKLELGVTDEDVVAARAIVDARKGVPDSVPKIGMLLDVGRDEKNNALLAQAAVRTLDIIDRIEQGKVAATTEQDVSDFYKNPMFNSIGKFPDPANVTAAQSINAMAALYEKKVGAGLEKEPKVLGFKSAALSSLQEAASAFRKLGHEQAASELEAVVASYAPKQPAPAPAAPRAPGL